MSAFDAMMLAIRPERTEDEEAILGVHAAAFPTDAEARLVQALRASGKAVVSLVAEVAGAIVGHVLFSPVSVHPEPGSSLGVGLAPLAVMPGHQRRGIGGHLVQSGLEACLRGGFGFAVVLGEPGYYRRFGFRRGRAEGLYSEYGVDEEFMVLELRPGALAAVSGIVQYGPGFAMVAQPVDPPAPPRRAPPGDRR